MRWKIIDFTLCRGHCNREGGQRQPFGVFCVRQTWRSFEGFWSKSWMLRCGFERWGQVSPYWQRLIQSLRLQRLFNVPCNFWIWCPSDCQGLPYRTIVFNMNNVHFSWGCVIQKTFATHLDQIIFIIIPYLHLKRVDEVLKGLSGCFTIIKKLLMDLQKPSHWITKCKFILNQCCWAKLKAKAFSRLPTRKGFNVHIFYINKKRDNILERFF